MFPQEKKSYDVPSKLIKTRHDKERPPEDLSDGEERETKTTNNQQNHNNMCGDIMSLYTETALELALSKMSIHTQ